MEDTDDKRRNEIVKMPQTTEEAHAMLNQVEELMKNLIHIYLHIGIK